MTGQFPKRRETDEEAAERIRKIEKTNQKSKPRQNDLMSVVNKVPDRELKAAIKEAKKFTGGE